MRKHKLLIALAVGAVIVGAVAFAQSTLSTGDQQQSLSELRHQAQRLELLAELPADARAGAEALLDRAEQLATATRDLEVKRMQAYVAALQAGDSPAVAKEAATAEVSSASVELTRQREELRADVEAFLTDHPDVSRSLRARLGASSGSRTFPGPMGSNRGALGFRGAPFGWQGMGRSGSASSTPSHGGQLPDWPSRMLRGRGEPR